MIVCLLGPSGIGKTKLSIYLAKKLDAIILNADATQIYKMLNIGSAKITEEEKENVPHFLFDIKYPNEDYSVCDYQKDGREILEKYKNKNIIVVGGTGLYINALFNNYEFSKMKDNNYDALSNEELYNLALKKDENMQIHKNNRVRLINFLNRNKTSNKKDEKLYNPIFIGLTLDRESLYNIANLRVEKMFDKGLLKEVEDLFSKYEDSKILKRAIGYKEFIPFFENKISLDEVKETIQKNTRHYIKRQYTWFNNQTNAKWFNVDQKNFSTTCEEVLNYILSLNSK